MDERDRGRTSALLGGLIDAKCDSAMKNKNLAVTILIVVVGAVLAWFGFGDKLGQKANDSEPQKVATSAPAQTTAPSVSKKSDDAAPAAKTEGMQAAKVDAPKPEVANSVDAKAESKDAEAAKTTDADGKTEAKADEQSAQAPAGLMAKPDATMAVKDQAKATLDATADAAKAAVKGASEAMEKTKEAIDENVEAGKQASEQAAKTVDAAATADNDAPSFDVVRVEPDGNTLVAGTAVPGSIVELMNGDQVLAKAKADESGAWVMVLEEALRKGAHDLRLAAKVKEGAQAIFSKSNIAVAIPENGELLVVESEPGKASKILAQVAKMAPKADAAAEKAMDKAADAAAKAQSVADSMADKAKEATADMMAKSSDAADTETQADASADASKAQTKDMAKDVTKDMADEKPVAVIDASVSVKAIELEGDVLYVAGDAKPAGSVLRLYVDNRAISDSKSSEAGTFLFDGPIALEVGSHNVRVDLLSGPDGKVLKRAQVSFEKKAPAMAKKADATAEATQQQGQSDGTQAALSSQSDAQAADANQVVNSRKVIIRRGDNLWEIARRVYGAGYRYSTIYDGNTSQIRNPHWIYPGQVFDLPDGEEGWEQNFDAVEAPALEEIKTQ